MHRLVILLLLGVITISTRCAAFNDESYRQQTARFTDSLKQAQIDTMLVYEHLCSGCIAGYEKQTFIFWQQSGSTYLCNFSSWHGRGTISSCAGVFSYFLANRNRLNTETIDTSVFVSHYNYSRIGYNVGSIVFTSDVPDYFVYSNENTELVRLMYMIEYRLCRAH
jgi:hypothetical protein